MDVLWDITGRRDFWLRWPGIVGGCRRIIGVIRGVVVEGWRLKRRKR